VVDLFFREGENGGPSPFDARIFKTAGRGSPEEEIAWNQSLPTVSRAFMFAQIRHSPRRSLDMSGWPELPAVVRR
jgi:hypothetical protein